MLRRVRVLVRPKPRRATAREGVCEAVMSEPKRVPSVRPRRTCVACRQRAPRGELLRLVADAEGRPFVDVRGGAPGRGAWLHPTGSCLARAASGALARGLRRPVRVSREQLWEGVRQAQDWRAASVLHAAWRAKQVAVGAAQGDHVAQAARSGAFVVVAADAVRAAAEDWVREAVRQGRAAAWGTQAALGRLTCGSPVEVAAVSDAARASALASAVWLSQSSPFSVGSRNVGEDASTEVR